MMTESKKKFVIIDAMSLAYKAYYAFISRPLTNSKGEPTSAVYGFVNQLLRIIEYTKPDYLTVAFDSKEKTFRHERYENYKSSREEMPEDMIPQIHKIKEIIEAFNIPLFILPGYEADDLIGTAVKKAEQKGLICYAITPDKDFIQLVTENVKIIKPGKSTDEIIVIDEKKVKEEFGFEPKQMIDYLALVGDSSDDIPGVAGIGPKSALPLIQEFSSIENIYKNIDKIDKKGIVSKLTENKENALLSKELATIKTDVPFEVDFEHAKFEKPNLDDLLKIFAELDFKTFAGKLKTIFEDDYTTNKDNIDSTKETANDIHTFDRTKVKYKLINSKKDAENLAQNLMKYDLIVFDTETDSLDTFNVNLAGCSFFQ